MTAKMETGYAKLIFTTTKNQDQTERFQQLVEECIEVLKENVKDLFAMVTFGGLTPLNTTNDVLQIHCPVRVETRPLWNSFAVVSRSLAEKMHEFAECNTSDELQFRTSVQIQDRGFFDIGALHGADLEQKVKEIHFGNLIKHDTFITHYIIDDDPRNGWYGMSEMMDFYLNKRTNEKENQTIYVDFEHDRRRLFIMFPVIWKDYLRNKNGGNSTEKKPIECVAKLHIGYNSIRRIFCTFETSKQDHTMILYLHLKSPPLTNMVKLDFKTRDGIVAKRDQSDVRTIIGDRYMHWIPYESFSKIKGDVRAVAESPYVRIKFTKGYMENCVHVLGRLFAASQRPIEVRHIKLYDEKAFSCHYLPSPLSDPLLRATLYLKSKGKEDFAAVYMIDALLSRGAHVKDQLMVHEEHRQRFIDRLISLYNESRKLALESLERLLNSADEQFDMQPLYIMLEEAIIKSKQAGAVGDDSNAMIKEGYIRLRKVTITPTRLIFEAPELIMGNRVLRADPLNFPEERFLRVAFRDDDWSRLQPISGAAKFIEKFVTHHMDNGIVVGDYYQNSDGDKQRHRIFNYLGSSNSQMRDQGCYFIEANNDEITRFRRNLGAFKTESVPKLMARFGQCFTQSHVTKRVLERNRYNFTFEYTGGSNSQGKEYLFSDGVGCMSRSFAREISKELELGQFIPSCVQSRFRGFKGVHAMNPNIDSLNQWARGRGYMETAVSARNHMSHIDLSFRGSQCKFRAPEENQFYEIVKLSGPSPVALNRPMINIMDQVSAMQGIACHQTVTNRIFQLLDIQLQQIAKTMVEETSAINRLREFPRVVMFDALQNINLTQEPFFRSMLRTAARCTLKKLRAKLQIAIPDDLGRSMLGVIDETGILSYGQVYIRYTVNMQQKRPGPAVARITHTGPVLITKNPMIVSGDVRMFEAVDIPALEHMCDVVVFPRWGHRPHPDEMAGSDLDGDEYSVIWDPQLFLIKSEEAFDYTAEKTIPEPVNEKMLRKQMADFFVKYMTHDSIGKLAVAFLVNSDIYGIESDVCYRVAKKHMQAVDFPKTGKPPDPLAKSNPDAGRPSEDPPRKPDFMETLYKPTYMSPRLNGRLFRRIKSIDDVLEASIDDQLNQSPKIDETFYVEGITEEDMATAHKNFNSYKAVMENLLQRFGISSEVEIFSNSYSVMRKRISDKEEDDFSFFNTQRLIEEEVEHIYSTHRRRLFEQNGKAFKDQVEWKSSNNKEREGKVILRSPVFEPSPQLQRLAVAYYKVAYTQEDQKYLSFAWLGADILARVRQRRIHQIRQQAISEIPTKHSFSFDPLSGRVSQHIIDYIKSRGKKFKSFADKILRWKMDKNRRTIGLILAYCKRHKGLIELLYFCYQWALQADCLESGTKRTPEENEQLRQEVGGAPAYNRLTICLTFIQFGLGRLEREVSAKNKPFLEDTDIFNEEAEKPEQIVDPNFLEEVNLFEQYGGLGAKFLQFLRFLSTLNFARMKRQTFTEFGLYTIFATQEHIRLHKAAESSYYKICFTDDFSTLPCPSDHQRDSGQNEEEIENQRPVVDGEAFVFELPNAAGTLLMNNQARLHDIITNTGIDDIYIRSEPTRDRDITSHFVVTVSGSLGAVNSLRRLLAPTGFINSPMVETKLSLALSSQILFRLLEIRPPNDEEVNRISTRRSHLERRRRNKKRMLRDLE